MLKNKKGNNRLFLNKKGELSITIILLVLLAVMLCGATLLVFNINLEGIKVKLVGLTSLDMIHVQENLIDFYVYEIMEKSIEEMNQEAEDAEIIDKENQFIENFNKELEKYKNEDGDYLIKQVEQLEGQLTPENIQINDNKVFLNLKLKIEREFDEKMRVYYSYDKTYEKILE